MEIKFKINKIKLTYFFSPTKVLADGVLTGVGLAGVGLAGVGLENVDLGFIEKIFFFISTFNFFSFVKVLAEEGDGEEVVFWSKSFVGFTRAERSDQELLGL